MYKNPNRFCHFANFRNAFACNDAIALGNRKGWKAITQSLFIIQICWCWFPICLCIRCDCNVARLFSAPIHPQFVVSVIQYRVCANAHRNSQSMVATTKLLWCDALYMHRQTTAVEVTACYDFITDWDDCTQFLCSSLIKCIAKSCVARARMENNQCFLPVLCVASIRNQALKVITCCQLATSIESDVISAYSHRIGERMC